MALPYGAMVGLQCVIAVLPDHFYFFSYLVHLSWLTEHVSSCNHLDGDERAGCFAWFVFLVSPGCCVALPRGAKDLSAVYDCGIS